MEKVIVAFESEKTAQHLREILESSATASVLLCHSGDEIRRAVQKQHIQTVVCGYKLGDESAETIFSDLPASCSMLLIATQGRLDFCANSDIFRLASPTSRSDLIASVRMLSQMNARLERFARPQRSEEERRLISRAKEVLMIRHGMTEAQAHRLLQKESMDNGNKLTETARMILESAD